MSKFKYFFMLCLCLMAGALSAQEAVNDDLNTIIKKHGLEQSEVMETASWLCDVYGPRLTGSPMLDKATDWAVGQLKEWNLENVHTEQWGPFGRGWTLNHFSMHAEAPNYFPIIAYPKAWSPSTPGKITGEVIYLDAATEEELETYRGKLTGKFVMIDTLRTLKEWFDPLTTRFDSEELLKMANAPMPTPRVFRNWRGSGYRFIKKMMAFVHEEKPLALLDRSYKGDLGTVFVSGARALEGRSRKEGAEVIPQATMSVEHYNRIFRLLSKNIPVRLSMDLQVSFSNPDGMEHNIFADIPGTDLKDEVVMFGAHFDSWHSGTGATDNGAGSAVMMEAARILMKTIKESGIQPRRTLRLALWTGEEQGLLGSRAYVKKHLANTDTLGNYVSIKPMQEKISAYYNLDNGSGKIRGIYLQGNPDVGSIFRAWLDPFKDLEANTITLSNTGGTDHRSFDAVGIPAFQFIQDPLSYWTRTHHSNMDNLDHLVEEDLQQAATIIASFVFHTAMRDEKLPRKALPFDEDAKKESKASKSSK